MVGTWVLPLFLIMSLTGLYWSYEWYWNGLVVIAGMEQPPARGGPEGPLCPEQGKRRAREPRREASVSAVDLTMVWTVISNEVPPGTAQTVTFNLAPEAAKPIEIRHMPVDAAHDRASNTVVIDPRNASVQRHDRYQDKRVGEKFMASIFPLHSGSFFGLPGIVI